MQACASCCTRRCRPYLHDCLLIPPLAASWTLPSSPGFLAKKHGARQGYLLPPSSLFATASRRAIGSSMAEDAPDGSGPLPKPAYTNVTSELTTDDEAFKHRPPYLTLKPDEFGPVTWRGRCHCGNIRYSLRREMPLNAKYCHCRGCQVMHGAPFQWAAIFHKSDMTFANGSCGLEFYSSLNQSSEYGTPTKVSCCHCRTPIMDEGRRVCLLFPTLIDLSGWDNETMERRKAFEASCHIFYTSRVVDILDGKPKWAGMDGKSDLLDDLGNIIQKWTPSPSKEGTGWLCDR